MRALKNKAFSTWAEDEGITDSQLIEALQEIERGLHGVSLGAGLYKKRVAAFGKGKSGGVRTILAYKEKDKAIFLYGFCKNQLDNINKQELLGLKKIAKAYLSHTDQEIAYDIYKGELIEVIL